MSRYSEAPLWPDSPLPVGPLNLMTFATGGTPHAGSQQFLIPSVILVNSTVVQLLSSFWFCDPMDHSMPGLPVHHQLPGFTQTLVHWVGDAIQPTHPLSSAFPFAFNLSQHQGLFQWVSSLHQVAQVLEVQQQTFQWIFRVDFLQIDWFELLAVQGTLKSLLQNHSSKTSILWLSTFFTVQLSHPYMTTGKTIALTMWTFVSKVMSILFNMLSNMSCWILIYWSYNFPGWIHMVMSNMIVWMSHLERQWVSNHWRCSDVSWVTKLVEI